MGVLSLWQSGMKTSYSFTSHLLQAGSGSFAADFGEWDAGLSQRAESILRQHGGPLRQDHAGRVFQEMGRALASASFVNRMMTFMANH